MNWYVPAVVSVTFHMALVHVLVLGLVVIVTPDGTELKSMLWIEPVSWLMKTTVVPGATVSVDGWKFSDMLEPTPLGMVMSTTAPDELLVVVVCPVDVVVVGGVDVVEVVEVVLEVVLLFVPGTKMKYAAPAINITTITAATIAPVPIPVRFCSNFMPWNSPD